MREYPWIKLKLSGLTTALDALSIYYDWIFNKYSESLWRDAFIPLEEGASISAELVKSGVTPKVDNLLINNYLESVKINLSEAEGRKKLYSSHLRSILGAFKDDVEWHAECVSTKIGDDPYVATSPLVEAREHAVRGAEARIKSMEATKFGEFYISLNLVKQSRSRSLAIPESNSQAVAINYRVPLFDGGNISSQVDALVAQKKMAQEALEQTRIDENFALESAKISLRTEILKLMQLRSTIDNSEKAVILSRERYKAGVGSLLEWLRAESDITDLRVQLLRSSINSALYKATIKVLSGHVDRR